MEFTREIIEKAKGTKTIEELMNLAKENNFEMTPEEATEYFAQFHRSGELSDEKLDNVSGGRRGGNGTCPVCGSANVKDSGIQVPKGSRIFPDEPSKYCGDCGAEWD